LPVLYRRARGLTGNAADAQDVSQEAVLKAWSRLEQFAGKQDESSTIFGLGFPALRPMPRSTYCGSGATEELLRWTSTRGTAKRPLGTALLRSNRIPKNGARGAKWGVCWRKRFRNFRRTCDKLACCGMCCTIRRRKSRAAWEYPSWQSACGYFGRIDGCAKSSRTHCASRCLPKPHPFARGWNARAHGPAASFPWHQATSAATSAGSPVLPCRPLPAHDSGKATRETPRSHSQAASECSKPVRQSFVSKSPMQCTDQAGCRAEAGNAEIPLAHITYIWR